MTPEEQKTIYKEIFPYGYYCKDRYLSNVGDIDEACKHIKDTKEDFIKSLKHSNSLIDDQHFDMQKYSLYYCEQDVVVLSKCVIKFREMLKKEFELELFDFISISSLSIKYQQKMGCFDGCSKVSGLLRKFF